MQYFVCLYSQAIYDLIVEYLRSEYSEDTGPNRTVPLKDRIEIMGNMCDGLNNAFIDYVDHTEGNNPDFNEDPEPYQQAIVGLVEELASCKDIDLIEILAIYPINLKGDVGIVLNQYGVLPDAFDS